MQEGRLHAIVTCKHKSVLPFILIESIFINGAEGTILPAATKIFTKPEVLAVVKLVLNKAGYTATEVACWWAGAIFEVPRPFGQEQ